MLIGYDSALQNPDAEPGAAVGRRDLLRALFGLSAAVLTCGSGGLGEGCSDSNALGDWLRYHGAGYFSDVAALRQLGGRYLAAHPEERSRQLLSHLLIDADGGAIPSRLMCVISRDWSQHHLAVVDGWLLARSEARLCALLHLHEGARA
jgi:hypothetical protein